MYTRNLNRGLFLTAVAAGLVLPVGLASAALTPYSQNFESLVQADPNALGNDGWKIFANVFSPDHSTYLYGYGVFPAPNPGGGFSAIASGQGGPAQGAQQLSVYSDYNNQSPAGHAVGNQIEVNVFQEQTIAVADVGSTWTFTFDAKLGNLVSPTTALAFIKTLDPNQGYLTTNFLTFDTTALPTSWGTYSLQIPITTPLVGQLLQIGFSNTASNNVASGVFYDNINFAIPSPAALPVFAAGGLIALRRRRA